MDGFSGEKSEEAYNRLRIVLVCGAIGVVAIIGMVSGLSAMSGPAQASMQADGWSVGEAQIEAANVTEVLLDTQPTAEWSNLPSEPTGGGFDILVEGPNGEMHAVYGATCSVPDKHWDCVYDESAEEGQIRLAAVQAYIRVLDGTPWTAEDFEAEPGETKTTSFDVRVEFTVEYEGGNLTASATDQATIEVTNPEEPSSTSTTTPNDTATPTPTPDPEMQIVDSHVDVTVSGE